MLLGWETEKHSDMIFYADEGDTPTFCTRKDDISFVREGVFGERENLMMKERWQVFSLFDQIPARNV